ncbi:MAG: hypothetical protein P4L39_07245 [Humidesulfovibrio sp.]|nr:hypothetical protein [Humidesulfovibrio sp.]
MEIFAVFDDEGLPKGFFTPVVHSHIPHGSCRISVEQWHEFIANKGARRWDGENIVEYVPISKPGPALSALFGQLAGPFLIFFNNSRGLAG